MLSIPPVTPQQNSCTVATAGSHSSVSSVSSVSSATSDGLEWVAARTALLIDALDLLLHHLLLDVHRLRFLFLQVVELVTYLTRLGLKLRRLHRKTQQCGQCQTVGTQRWESKSHSLRQKHS